MHIYLYSQRYLYPIIKDHYAYVTDAFLVHVAEKGSGCTKTLLKGQNKCIYIYIYIYIYIIQKQ